MTIKDKKTEHSAQPRRASFSRFALAVLVLAFAGGLGTARAADGSQGPPRVVSTVPALGATDVDPALKEITVTFDQDMGDTMSWTGSGAEHPPSPEGAQGYWRDKRTCVLPVALQAGHLYRVGINSKSYQNFRSADGVPAIPTAISFTTQGASEQLKRRVVMPAIVGLTPVNGAKDVSPSVTELRVTFNTAMADSFTWAGGGPEFPAIPECKKPYWDAEHKTCTLPVALKPNASYRLGLNSPSFKGFQTAGGVPLVPVVYTFHTGEK